MFVSMDDGQYDSVILPVVHDDGHCTYKSHCGHLVSAHAWDISATYLFMVHTLYSVEVK